MKIYTPFLFFYILLATACAKEELSYKIEGQLSDKNTGLVLANSDVSLYQKEFQTGVLNSNYNFVATTQTDAEGKYRFEIERIRIYEIKLEINNPDYYEKISIYQSSQLNAENINYFDEVLESRSWVTILLKNPIIGGEEQLNMQKSKFKEGCNDCCSNGLESFFEMGDTTFTCAAVGGTQVILDYGVTGSPNQFKKVIDCIPFDTTFVEITY